MATKKKEVVKEKKKFNYYAWLVDHDFVGWMESLRQREGWKYRPGDMKLEVINDTPPVTPWHYIKATEGDCWPQHHIFLNELAPHSKLQFIPEWCHECYKVVVRPRTLKELFTLEELQKKLNLPSKCGIEVRTYVPALYGGYFYNRGLEAGKACYKTVREAVNKCEGLGPEVEVYLKRACTEMERRYGDSSKWLEITDEQKRIEKMVYDMIAYSPNGQKQPSHFIAHVHRNWIEFAFRNGDKTYLEYTAGLPLEPPARTYHDEE